MIERRGRSGGTERGTTPRPPTPPDWLPPVPQPFFGRQAETAALRAEIDRPGLSGRGGPARASRVLLVAGRPGVGRTALALHLAHQVAGDYPDGRFFARLVDRDRRRVPVRRVAVDLLRAFGAPAPPETVEAELVARVRRVLTGRRALLVLDDVADSEQVLPLLPPGSGCLVVVTASGPLTAVPDVRPCVLGGLDLAAATALLGRTLGSTRVACDPRAVEALVQECGAHPTALRLAGGALAAQPRMSVADAVSRLHEPGAQDTGPRTPLARAFHLAYEGLPAGPARMLRLLVLAPAGVVDAHVASALSGSSVRVAGTVLRDLADQGLLTPDDVPGEYRVPGCLHAALTELSDALDRPAEITLAVARMLERTVRQVGACHAALCPAPPEQGGPVEPPPRDLRFASRRDAADWLRRRLPALLAAASAAAADGDLDTLARRLVAALVQVLCTPEGEAARAGSLAELYLLHRLLHRIAVRRGRPREQAAALINLADLDVVRGRRGPALDGYREALAAARRGRDETLAARALEAIGDTHAGAGDLQRAADWYGRALAVRLARGERADEARLRGLVAGVQLRMGRWDDAARGWRAVAALHRRLDDVPAAAQALTELAHVWQYAGDPEECLRTYREALLWARQAEDVRLEAAVLLRMADTLERLGDPAGARVQRAEAERLLAG
ncbi:NB-ARC domain-containing protein [Wenjunlia vitaminophila]|uniref:NB-ARC domain-containing protein n=1 Tax=Wenjunlia vitaminophila TaxID=76728 RepID=UPI00131A2781|nr:NB-ARC domain-containing protein [Wenjunlia vitaminophila]